jgi:hypothetical protein
MEFCLLDTRFAIPTTTYNVCAWLKGGASDEPILVLKTSKLVLHQAFVLNVEVQHLIYVM